MAVPKDPIIAAFEHAVRDFKATLGDEKLLEDISKTTSIEDVYNTTDALQKEQREKGRLRHLAKIQPFLEGLRSYASVIEVFIQSKQDVLSLIWGPIKLLLHWTNNMKQSFDAIVDALADIGLLLPEFQEVRKLFSHNEHIKDVLVFFFRDILNFYLIVLKFFRKTYWGLIFESMWTKQREKIDIVRAQIQRHTLLLRREVGLEHIQEAQKAQQQALEHYEKTEKSFRRQEYQSLKTNISPRSYEDRLDSYHARICQGTGQWLLRDTIFIKWLDKSDASMKILWLQGIPGAGKTYLSSTVIHKAKEVEQTRTIYAFLSHTFRSSLSALSVLHSLIFQLASGCDDVQDVLCQSSGEALRSSVDAAAKLLKTLLSCAGPTYIVIDGVDEVDERERFRLLKQLIEISGSCQNVKTFISSRAEADITDLLQDQVSIRVDNRNAGGIQTFVNKRTEEWMSKCNFVPEAEAEIRGLLAPLASNAKGMFLYAEVVLSSMDYLDDMEEIRGELKVLPEGLNAAYSRILDRINGLGPSLKDKVRKILGWIECAPIPLTIQELEQALVVSREGIKGVAKVIAVLNMPRICGPIVEVVDDYVQFVHFTVKEYFFSSSINGSLNFADATFSLATCCITYLCQMHHDHDLLDKDIDHNILCGAYRLHDFAAATWFELIERCVQLVRQDQLSGRLIDVLETLRCERTQGTYIGDSEVSAPSFLGSLRSISPPLHDMLCKVDNFRRISLRDNFDKEKGSSWIRLDPLTTSASSVRVYERVSDLLCRNNKHQDCHCEVIRGHYGRRPFKCGYLNCPFRRHGFASLALQKLHIKHHGRPWKCNIEDCDYAEGGFFSRKMRDDHYQDHIPKEPQGIPHAENLLADEIQPLLFDLVKADKVDVVRSLLDQYKALPQETQFALQECAASFGSAAMVDLIEPFDANEFPKMSILLAIRSANTDLFKHLLSRSKDCKNRIMSYPLYTYSAVVDDVLLSDSEEILEEWVKYVNIEVEFYRENSTSTHFWTRYTPPHVINATSGHSGRENLLITVWEKTGVFKSINHAHHGKALLNVAKTTCSVKLAKHLVDHGAEVDFKRGKSLTALHHAARQTSAAAADMMKYLLLQGADPERKVSRGGLKICDEKGAKGIAQWLGMSWDELVATTKEQREKIA